LIRYDLLYSLQYANEKNYANEHQTIKKNDKCVQPHGNINLCSSVGWMNTTAYLGKKEFL
jgi:hypothetical protein